MSALRAPLGAGGLGAGAALALVLLAGCQTVGTVDPDPIDVASSGERTEDAIRDALRRDGWEIESWSPGEVYAGKVDAGEPLRIRIHLVDETLRISWIDDGTVEGSFEEVNERKREIRRALRNLSERIEYHIESVDLEARNDAARELPPLGGSLVLVAPREAPPRPRRSRGTATRSGGVPPAGRRAGIVPKEVVMLRAQSHRRPWVVGGIAGALSGIAVVSFLLAAPAFAQTAVQWVRGGGFAGKVAEPRFVYTHNEGEKLAVDTARDLFKVPEDYGEPFAVTVENNQQIVWYRSTALGVRNVIIESDRRLVHLLPRANLQKNAAEEEPAAR